MNSLRTAAAVALCSLAATGVTACTPSSSPAPKPTDVHTPTSAAASPSTAASEPATTTRPARPTPTATSHRAARPTTHPHTTSSAPPAPVQPSTSAVAGPAVCANGTVDVSAQRGGALPGEELAVLVFTNRSSSACSITGFPGVELFAHDNVIGKPAARSTMDVRTLTVAPGAHVTALLHDDTRCNADLSDQVGVFVPNQTTQERVPLQLRACTLTIDPVRR